jgi:hypothetical protein
MDGRKKIKVSDRMLDLFIAEMKEENKDGRED